MVNAVIVRTEALLDASEVKPLSMQNASPKG